jgi:transcriptional regulator with XRE-family HTH domain
VDVVGSGSLLREARSSAGLTQRELARRAGVPQPTVARIESGAVMPRVDTLDRLLRWCGRELTTAPRAGTGVDRGQIVEMRRLPPRARLELLVRDERGLTRLMEAAARR